MTARPFWDPVTGAAIAHLGLPILPALPCPKCAGSKREPYGYVGGDGKMYGFECRFCNGSGVWTPPDHPVTIGVTSATADAMLDQDERMHEAGYDIGIISDQRSGWELATRPPGEEWTSGNTVKHPIVLSSVTGEATLRKLKVVNTERNMTSRDSYVRFLDGRHLHLFRPDQPTTDISSALPFLPGIKPGDTVYLAEGFTESVVCPHCDGTGGWGDVVCDFCTEGSGRLSCPFPVDAPDHPCVLEAT